MAMCERKTPNDSFGKHGSWSIYYGTLPTAGALYLRIDSLGKCGAREHISYPHRRKVEMKLNVAVPFVLLIALSVQAMTSCAADRSTNEAGSLPAKGYSEKYGAVDDALQLGNAHAVCSDLSNPSAMDRNQLIRSAHPDLAATGWTAVDWIELEMAYLAVCYSRDLWPAGTVANLSDLSAFDAMIEADPDTADYCEVLSDSSDEEAQDLLQKTHTGPLYVSLKDIEIDRISLHVAYVSACTELGLWTR